MTLPSHRHCVPLVNSRIFRKISLVDRHVARRLLESFGAVSEVSGSATQLWLKYFPLSFQSIFVSLFTFFSIFSKLSHFPVSPPPPHPLRPIFLFQFLMFESAVFYLFISRKETLVKISVNAGKVIHKEKGKLAICKLAVATTERNSQCRRCAFSPRFLRDTAADL